MEHADSAGRATGGPPNPVDHAGLCLLSLDGGGVRGLSTLHILKRVMTQLNHERQKSGGAALKPCGLFDLIGGTSTGGLIAIMLGRLEMDVDDCIIAYNRLIKTVFEEKAHRTPMSWSGRVQSRFDSAKLKAAIDEVSHKLQPCDVGVFGPLKSAYREQVERLYRGGANTVGKEHFTTLYSRARDQALTCRNIKAGWSKAGLVPFNPDRVLQDLQPPNESGGSNQIRLIQIDDQLSDVPLVTPVTAQNMASCDSSWRKKLSS